MQVDKYGFTKSEIRRLQTTGAWPQTAWQDNLTYSGNKTTEAPTAKAAMDTLRKERDKWKARAEFLEEKLSDVTSEHDICRTQLSNAMVRRIQEENAGALSTQPTEPQSAEPEVVNTSNKKKRCEVCGPKMDRKTQYTCIKCKKYICNTHTVKLCPSCVV